MPLSEAQLNPPISRTSLGDFIKSQSTGFSNTTQVADSIDASNNRNIVLAVNPNPSNQWVQSQCRISISNTLSVVQNLQEGWTGSNAPINQGNSGAAVAFISGLPIISRRIVNGNEINLLLLSQANTHAILGFIQPASPNEIEPSLLPIIFQFNAVNNRILTSDARTPYGVGSVNSSYEYIAPTSLGGVNHVAKRDTIPFIVMHTSRKCVHSIGSSNIIVGAGDGVGLFEQIGDYYCISTVSPCVLVRP